MFEIFYFQDLPFPFVDPTTALSDQLLDSLAMTLEEKNERSDLMMTTNTYNRPLSTSPTNSYHGEIRGSLDSLPNMRDESTGDNEMESEANELYVELDAEAAAMAKDPLYLAEAAEWTELGGVMLRRLRQLSVTLDEEIIPPLQETSVTAAVEIGNSAAIAVNDPEGGGLLPATASVEGICSTDDVWNAVATVFQAATGGAAAEVVDPDLDLDYIPPATSSIAPNSPPGSVMVGPASTVGEGPHHVEEGGSLWIQHLHRHHQPHHSHV